MDVFALPPPLPSCPRIYPISLFASVIYQLCHPSFLLLLPSFLHLLTILPLLTQLRSPLRGQFTQAHLVRWTDLHRFNVVNLPSPRPRLGGRAVTASGVFVLGLRSTVPTSRTGPLLFWVEFLFIASCPFFWIHDLCPLPLPPLYSLYIIESLSPPNYSVTPYSR